MIKRIIRLILRCKKDETINDAIYRHKVDISKYFYKKKYNKNDLRKVLMRAGIKKNDNIMIHCGYKSFYNFYGTPNDVIDIILDLIGKNGNLIMPCYGKNKFIFNVDDDKSATGVLSECFRKRNGVIRSKGAHFSCAAYGKDKSYLTNDHEKSTYGFDQYSPYYKFVELNNSKIIMLGLGKKSVKLSLYHIPEMILLENSEFYKSIFKKKYTVTVTYMKNGKLEKVKHSNMLLRENTLPNRKEISKLYRQEFVKSYRISNLDIIVIDAKKALKYIIDECNKGHYMIKQNKF